MLKYTMAQPDTHAGSSPPLPPLNKMAACIQKSRVGSTCRGSRVKSRFLKYP